MIAACLFVITGCYATTTGTVVDAETGQPIEGAVVLAEWTITKGLGLSYSTSYEVVETLTDREGKVTISGVFNPFVNYPLLTVYKKGYVAWNNQRIFPDNQRRTDFKWSDGYVFRLEKFRPEYSYDKHTYFIRTTVIRGMAGEKKQLMINAYRWEEQKASEERRKNK
jgi:hypothetical protein